MKFRLRSPFKADLETLREAFRTFGPTLHDQKGQMVAAGAFAAVATGLELLRPWPVKYVIDEILLAPDRGGVDATRNLFLAAAVVAVIAAALGQVTLWNTVKVAEIGRKVATRLRRRTFAHLHRLDLPFLKTQATGDLLIRLMGDVTMIRDLLFASWLTLLTRGAILLAAFGFLLYRAPVLALVALIPIPFLCVSVSRDARLLTKLVKKQRKKEGDTASFAAESLQQVGVVKAYAAEERATADFSNLTRVGERAGVKAARRAAAMGRSAEAMTGLGLGLVLFFGTRLALRGALTPGDLVVLLSYTRLFYKPLRKIAREGARLSKASACASRLLEVLRHPPEPRGGDLPAPSSLGDIRLEQVVVRYSDRHPALSGIDLVLPAGSFAVLRGPNGAGKSTLLALLLRLVRPASGRLVLDGKDADEFDTQSIRERIAYVPQDNTLFSGSIRDNILYGRPDASDADIEEAAALALVDEIVADWPLGLDTEIGEGGGLLSGGERRRVALARAALRSADLLLLDEPFVGLDPVARRKVAVSIRRLAAGRTTICVHHGPLDELDPELEIVLEGGRVARIEERVLER